MSRPLEQVDLVIVGGGMVGMAAACALKDSGLHVVVVERSEPVVRQSLGRDCRVSAIVTGNVRILQNMGVWEHIKDAGPMHAMRIWDDQRLGGIRFDACEIGEDALGYLVENSKLQAAMLKAAHLSDSIDICCPAVIDSVVWHSDHVEVRLDDGRGFSTPLIVGADGAHSWLRNRAEIGICSHDYGQKGIVATVRPQMFHHGIAFQRFLSTGPLAMLPLSGGLCSIVWSAGHDEAERLMTLDDVAFLEDLNLAFGPVLGRIEETGERAAFPLVARLARHLVRPRLALIGDAAHTIHPLAGLGVNLGLRDAMVLAQEITDAKRFREDWGEPEVLERYMKQRLPDILTILGAMEGFHQLFTHNWPGLPELRGLGMRLVGNSGPIKHILMRNATGLSLPVPGQIS
ncbi:MAG: UbiH/UbiF/VisC/COQ6 family ubiquinone biosynthesis hydroxylase [Mariprofundaceae bacterium]|nr:UbiH/UbiF/VisC/COQ6 family ubiquinone biosynthesis hydroxylase [Mariprofundaceae bacterium]